MDQPNDIDYAIYDARLEGMNDMYLAAVHAYRQGIIDALSAFAKNFVRDVHAVRLCADVDWRWVFDAFLDSDGQEIEADFGDIYFEDLFSPSILSELEDIYRASYGYIYLADREFVDLAPADWAEHKRVHSLTSEPDKNESEG